MLIGVGVGLFWSSIIKSMSSGHVRRLVGLLGVTGRTIVPSVGTCGCSGSRELISEVRGFGSRNVRTR